MLDLTEFMDMSAPLDVPIRQPYCPFCEPDKVTSHGFVVTRRRNGFSMWCHRCHTKRFIRTTSPSPVLVSKYIREKQEGNKQESVVKRNITLPSDFTTDIPASGLLWLRTYGVTDEEIKQRRFGYSPSLDRLILPVFREEGLVFWQGRNLSADTTRPKYLNVRSSRSDVVMMINRGSSKVVVVEDILSCLAVSRAGYSCVALLGSYVNFDLIKPVLSVFGMDKQYRIWLDSDKRKESCKYAKQLSAVGIRATPIVLPNKDPKEYTYEQIQHILK